VKAVEVAKPRSFLLATVHASLAAIVGYAPGGLVPIAIASVYGATGTTDAFLLALSVASLVANSLGAMTQQAAIPFLIQARRDGHNLGQFIAEISSALLIMASVPTVTLNLAVLFYIGHHTTWTSTDVHTLTVFIWAFVPYLVCSILAGVYSGVLNAEHRYARAAFSPAIRSVVVLGSLVLAPIAGVLALLFGYIAGEFLRLLSLFRALGSSRGRRIFARPTARLMEFSHSAIAQMAASGVLACVPLMDRMMASQLPSGSVSLLDYADRLWQVPIGFALSGFMVTSLTHWSERLHTGGTVRSLARDTCWTAACVFIAVAPFAWGFVAWRAAIIQLVFGTHKFTAADLTIIADTLGVLMAVTPLYIAGLVYTRGFLILKRSDWLLAIAILQVVMKAFLNVALLPRFGVVGIGIATALMFSVSSLLVIVIFHLRLTVQTANAPSSPGVPTV
jgi:putative peptidoglycan lipid II flippase